MTTAKAILAGAAIIAVSVILIGAIPRAEAQRMGGGGPYQIMHHSNPTANAGVFRLDTASGEISYCFLAGAPGTEQSRLSCTRATP